MRIDAVLLDLGTTLIFQARQPDDDTLYGAMAEQVQPLLDAWRAHIDAAALVRDLYRAVEPAQAERRTSGLEVDGGFVTQGALAEHGFDATAEQARQVWTASAVGLDLWGWQLYPDTLDTLRKLAGMPLKVGIVSNSSYTADTHGRLLQRLDLREHLFEAFVSSADVMRLKPRPEPFQRALALLDVTASACVFVGDDLEADIRGAAALGMTTVWKLNGRQDVPPAPEADYMIHDLWELFTLDLLPGTSGATQPESPMPHDDANAERY